MQARVGYAGTTPGADANTYVLFATCNPGTATDPQNANWGQNALGFMFADKFTLNLDHVQAGTLNAYVSQDHGTTWGQLSTEAIAAPAASGSTYREFNLEGLMDWKLEWVNGGVAQNPWRVNMSIVSVDRAAP
jgi:hypothetical protein